MNAKKNPEYVLETLKVKQEEGWQKILDGYDKAHPGKRPSPMVLSTTKAGYDIGFMKGAKEVLKALVDTIEIED